MGEIAHDSSEKDHGRVARATFCNRLLPESAATDPAEVISTLWPVDLRCAGVGRRGVMTDIGSNIMKCFAAPRARPARSGPRGDVA
jgi:hypothetical protein